MPDNTFEKMKLKGIRGVTAKIKRDNTGWIISEPKFSYLSKPVKHIKLISRKSQHWAEYSSMLAESRNCLYCLTEISKALTDDDSIEQLHTELFISALVRYGKCFNSSGARQITLNADFIDEGFREIHQQMFMLRNNYAAHVGSGKDSSERQINSINAYAFRAGKGIVLATDYMSPHIYRLDEFINLVKHLISKLEIKEKEYFNMVNTSEEIVNYRKK